MHETALAKRILEEVLSRAEGRRVRVVRGAVMEDEALSAGALGFHFEAHARGTVAQGAALELELRHVRATCQDCKQSFLPDHHVRLCPSCGSSHTILEGETGVRIDSIEVDEVG